MDAFELIVAQVLDVGGYWTRIGVKESEIEIGNRGIGVKSKHLTFHSRWAGIVARKR